MIGTQSQNPAEEQKYKMWSLPQVVDKQFRGEIRENPGYLILALRD